MAEGLIADAMEEVPGLNITGTLDTAATVPAPELNTAAPDAAPSASATTLDAATPTAALQTVDPATGTVAGQLNTLLSKESGLMTQARTKAAQASNARGLLNSSIAAEAGESAAIASALPIAAADANIYAQTAAANQAAQQQMAAQQLIGQQQMAAQQLIGQQQVTLQDLQAATAKDLANIEASYKTLMQTSASAGQVMAAAQSGINEIMANTTLSNAAKTALITQLQAGLEAQLGVLGGMAAIDLSELLVFPEVTL